MTMLAGVNKTISFIALSCWFLMKQEVLGGQGEKKNELNWTESN